MHSWIESALAKIEGVETQAVEGGGLEPGEKVLLLAQSLETEVGADWPGFHGPNRDNLCRQTGLNMD